MRKTRQPRPGYIDGVVFVYDNKSGNVSSFNAVKNAVDRSDLDLKVKLRYNIRAKREEDIAFAEAHDRILSLKIVTPLYKSVEVGQYAFTNGVLYTLYNVDYDDVEGCMYLYLEEVRKLS